MKFDGVKGKNGRPIYKNCSPVGNNFSADISEKPNQRKEDVILAGAEVQKW